MQQLTQQELERRVKQLMERKQRPNPQQTALGGRGRRPRGFNVGDIDLRQLGLGNPKKQEAAPETEPIPEEPIPPKLPADEGDLDELGENLDAGVGDAPAPTGTGLGIGVLSPLATPFALSVIANMMGVPVPFTNPIALAKMVKKAIGMSMDNDGDQGISPSTSTAGSGLGDASPGPEGSGTDSGPTPGPESPGPAGSSTDTGPYGGGNDPGTDPGGPDASPGPIGSSTDSGDDGGGISGPMGVGGGFGGGSSSGDEGDEGNEGFGEQGMGGEGGDGK